MNLVNATNTDSAVSILLTTPHVLASSPLPQTWDARHLDPQWSPFPEVWHSYSKGGKVFCGTPWKLLSNLDKSILISDLEFGIFSFLLKIGLTTIMK